MTKHLLFLLLLLPTLLFGQENAVLTIYFSAPASDTCVLKIDATYIDEYNPELKSAVNNNHCSFSINTNRIITATLKYRNQNLPVYLVPGDALRLDVKNDSLLSTASFSGSGSAWNNNLFCYFYKQFANDFNNSIIQQQMLTTAVDAFEMRLFDARKKQKAFYLAQDQTHVSNDFKRYMEHLIKYNYYACLLTYPITNANQSNTILRVNALPEVMLEGVDSKLINDEALICNAYRDFITHYVIYFTSKANGFNKFSDYNISMEKKIMMAKTLLSGKTLIWYISNFLNSDCEKVSPYTVKHIYGELKELEKEGIYFGLLKNKCEARIKAKEVTDNTSKQAVKPSDNSKNPFQGVALKDVNGKAFNPKDIEGKVVFVDFWASWCGPCRKEFPASKALHDRFTSKQLKNIVFLYISIDGNEGNWRNAANQIGMKGLSLISPGDWSSPIVKYFGINSIPRYMLLDKKGKVINANAPRPSSGDEIYNEILNLLAQ